MAQIVTSDHEKSIMARAAKVLPAGGFGNFPADIVLKKGKGSRVWDESGNEYIDFLIGSGPMIVGHCNVEVNEVVREQLELGATFFANSTPGIDLAEVICDAVACAEQIRYVSTGSEADMYAMRLARAHRKKDKILKFEGGYHGMSDYSLMSLAPKTLANFPQAVPDSAGISDFVKDNVIVAPFNDIEAMHRLINEYKDELAGVIVEPLQRLIPPKPGFLEALREETKKHGIVLIFDEVVTGFRFAYGGAQEVYGVTPDLCTLGKIIGGGFPMAAIAGSEEIMAHFDKAKVGEEGFTFQVGTLSGNPVASVAGLKTMEILRRPGSYQRMYDTGNAIMKAISDSFSKVGIPAQVVGHPTLFDVVFTDREVVDYRGVFHGDANRSKQFNVAMRQAGILKPDSKFYIMLAHTDEDVAYTTSTIQKIAEEMAG